MCDQTRFYYLALPNGVEGLVECRIIDVNRRQLLGIGYFDNPHDFMCACADWNGRANIYAGRNPRPPRLCEPSRRNKIVPGLRAAKSEDIETVTMVSLDFDPVRSRDLPSTDAEEEAAFVAAVCAASEYAHALVMRSGNGSQVLIPVIPFDVRGKQQWFEARAKVWEEGIREDLALAELPDAPKVKLDSQYDLPRIIKVPGTLSVKGHASHERPHRMAKFDDWGVRGTRDVLKELMEVNHVTDADEPRTGRQDPISPAESIPELFWKLLTHDQRLRRTWEGQRDDFPSGSHSRSEFDLSLATQLARYGLTPGEILAILLAFPHGRNTTGTASYFDWTIDEAVHPGRRARNRRGQA